MTHTLELTDQELRKLDSILSGVYGSGTARGIREKIAPLLPAPVVKCYHCREVQETEAGYEKHLRKVHHYVADGSQDDSYGEAWNRFHQMTRCLVTGAHTH